MNDEAQFRVLEAVIASTIIVAAFAVSTQLGRMARTRSAMSNVVLTDEAFSVISQLCDSGILDSVLSSDNPQAELDSVLRTFLQPGMCFKAMIYKVDTSSGYPTLVKLFSSPVTNIPKDYEPPEMVSVKYFYTSLESGEMYLLVLSIGRRE